MRMRCATKDDPPHSTPPDFARHVLDVATSKDDAHAGPRVVVERAVIVVPQELVEVYIEEAVPWNHPPTEKVRVFFAADDEVGFAVKELRDAAQRRARAGHPTL